ncbi:Lrp/AsnC family transcriptional regulator [Pseudaestuariivita sp.]|uniref:Lrp/AsnC family transcriptional regulator n=1 Tax=Pseudaestuariivita sp. TaxID=2211669 RepID=UPI00405A414E
MLSDIDRHLLTLLKRDARLSLTELAAETGASRNTVRQRLTRLQETGTIQRFTIDTAVTEEQVRAIVTIALNGALSRSVIRALKAIGDIEELHSTNGAWDLVAQIASPDLATIDAVLRRIREIPGVTNSETSLLLARV